MTTAATARVADPLEPANRQHHIPLHRIVSTELRKMFDTRSGFWLLASTAILALLASAAVIVFARPAAVGYHTYVSAIAVPMTLVLPIIAILSVTSEFTQRTGLTTFTLVPRRGRIIGAKAIAGVVVALVCLPLAFGIGAVGTLIGSAVAGVGPTWDLAPTNLATIALGNVLSLLVGFMFGVVIRNSVGALVAYVVYQFLLPTLTSLLAGSRRWFRDVQPWIDFDHAQNPLFDGSLTGRQWTQLGITGLIWLAIPLIVGLKLVARAEVA